MNLKCYMFVDEGKSRTVPVICNDYDAAFQVFCDQFGFFEVKKVVESSVLYNGFPKVILIGITY